MKFDQEISIHSVRGFVFENNSPYSQQSFQGKRSSNKEMIILENTRKMV